jgi:hypothetical protein
MKYLIVILVCLYSNSSKAQVIDSSWYTIDSTYSHTDSINIQLIDTILAHKNSYIGYPMSKLYNVIYHPIRFSSPDNIGISRGYGTAYYQDFTLFLPISINDGNYGFFITIANKVYLRVKDYIGLRNLSERYNYVKELLKNAVITSIEKNY